MLVISEIACFAAFGRKKKQAVVEQEPASTLVPTLVTVLIFWVLPLLVIFVKTRKVTIAMCELAAGGKPQHPANTSQQKSAVTGTVKISQRGGSDLVTIEYEIKGLKPGKHGFHIHETSDFSNGLASTGPHYNPYGKNHGAPDVDERHLGGLGNVVANASGIAKGSIIDRLVKLDGPTSVIGRSFIVHADEDDLGKGDNSQPGPPPVNGKCSLVTGNAGARIAGGAIYLAP